MHKTIAAVCHSWHDFDQTVATAADADSDVTSNQSCCGWDDVIFVYSFIQKLLTCFQPGNELAGFLSDVGRSVAQPALSGRDAARCQQRWEQQLPLSFIALSARTLFLILTVSALSRVCLDRSVSAIRLRA